MLTSAIITFMLIHCMDNVQYQIRNNTLKSTVLPPAKAKKSIWNMSASFGLCLRQHCKILTSAFMLTLNLPTTIIIAQPFKVIKW